MAEPGDRGEGTAPDEDDALLGPTVEVPGAAPAREPDRIGQRIGRFDILARLGAGGMGVVYVAEDRTLRRRVALKVLAGEITADDERRRRFLREGRAAAALVHPNVTTVFEVAEDAGVIFIAMELIEGETLRAALDRQHGKLPPGEALRVAREIARGLDKAHRAGIVHRDIKPENVMLGEGGLVKILDFGLAKWVDPSASDGHGTTSLATVEGRILGTPSYMSPEQAEGRPFDARTDLFSLGVVLYEMLTGVRPFRGTTSMEVLVSVCRDAPKPVSALLPEASPALDEVVQKCLEKKPEARFDTAAALIEALDAIPLEPRSVPRARPEEIQRNTPVVGRRRAAVFVIGAVSLLALVAIAARPLLSAKQPAATAPVVAPPEPIRRVCETPDGGAVTCHEGSHSTGWCDASGRQIACCGPGLVPLGSDGRCGCAPGGTHVAEALSRGCAPPPPDADAERARRKREMTDRVLACFSTAIKNGSTADGDFAAQYMLAPEGSVIDARVNVSSVPDSEAQGCALAAVRATRFLPPLGEDAGRMLGFGFKFKPGACASASAPREPPPRHPCAAPPADGRCAAPLPAWCDLDEKPIACCAKGLAATGEDGLCGCPPGGVKDVPGAPLACHKAKEGPDEAQVQAVVRPAFKEFHGCYDEALRRTKNVAGRVSVTFELTPEGRVFKARIAGASLPDPEMQVCLLQAFRKLVFDPPTDGHRTVTYPISFSPGD